MSGQVEGDVDRAAAPSDNNVVRASARLRRAAEYTAPRPRGLVNELARSDGARLRSLVLAPRREPLNVK